MIPYAVRAAAGGVVFESEGPRSAMRYRLTYINAGKDRVKILLNLIGVDVPVQISKWQIRRLE